MAGNDPIQAKIQEALIRRDANTALGLINGAEAANPADIDLKLQKAFALRLLGRIADAIGALDEALTREPYHFVALLSKGALVEQTEGKRAAAAIYRNALKICPVDVPASLTGAVAKAREVVEHTADALAAYLESKTATARAGLDPIAAARFDEGTKIHAGKGRAYHSEGVLLTYPRLPAISYFDRALFPWLPELEAATDMIRGELENALATMDADFAPYIEIPPGAPVNQWTELNHSRKWSTLFLWKDGVHQDKVCARCSGTAALLEKLPLARQPGFAPTAMFSALQPRAHIPAHTGSTNVRSIVHLPLQLPGPARFRVGNETRFWKMGEAWVFDDSIDHEAWNESDGLRVILIFDVWNPLLNEPERTAITALMAARNEFLAQR